MLLRTASQAKRRRLVKAQLELCAFGSLPLVESLVFVGCVLVVEGTEIAAWCSRLLGSCKGDPCSVKAGTLCDEVADLTTYFLGVGTVFEAATGRQAGK
jgi:hypothetical protein